MSDAPRKRPRFQFHLSTAIVAMLVASLLLPVVLPYFESAEQGMAAGIKWDLAGTVSDFGSSVANNQSPYRLSVLKKPQGFFLESELILSDSEVKEIGRFDTEAGPQTPFWVDDDVLYYADYSPISSGCRLIAFDCRAQGLLWSTYLKGLGGVPHSIYRNNVNLKRQGGAIIVFGNELGGKYIECIDTKNGKAVGHRAFDLMYTFQKHTAAELVVRILFWLLAVICAAVTCEYIVRRRERQHD